LSWTTSSPAEQGIRAQAFIDLEKQIRNEKILSCLIIKNGSCVFEYHKNGKMERKQHKINSCTKSILSALIGIAIEQGHIQDGLETPIATFFPAVAHDEDVRKRSITIDHLLSMSAGYHFPEFGEWNGFPHMIHSKNWVKYVLERQLERNPGEAMNYNSGCSHLLTAILQQAVGQDAERYARKQLFGPLGITDFIWHEDRQGVKIGGFGLHMKAHDMAKFGLLYLRRGAWGDKQIVPEVWVADTTAPRYLTYPSLGHYGRHWWVSSLDGSEDVSQEENRYFFALGYGGQYIIVVPQMDLVAVFASEIYSDSQRPLRIFRSTVLHV